METNFNEEETLQKEYDSKLMRRLLKFAKPYKNFFIIVMLLMLVATALDLSRTYIIKMAIDNHISVNKREYSIVDTPSKGSMSIQGINIVEGNVKEGKPCSLVYFDKNYYMVKGKVSEEKIKDISKFDAIKLTTSDLKILRKDDADGVIRFSIIILIISVTIFFLNYTQIYLLQLTGQKIVFNIRKKLFQHTEMLSLSFYDKNPVGRLVTRLTNDVETLNDMYTGVLVYLIKDIFLLVGILTAMFLLNAKLALIVLASVPLIIGGSILFKKYDREAYRQVRTKLAKINSSLSENISGMKTVQIFNKEDKKFKEFDGVNNSYKKATMKQVTVFAIFRPSIELIYSLVLALLLWFGGIKVLNNGITFGVLYAFVNYLSQFFQPIFDLTEKYDILQSSMASSERIFMLMDNNNMIANAEKPLSLEKVRGEIEFKHVWFAYTGEDWVLKDVSFKIAPGEKVAFVGATGAGKTSIISLIQRLYDIQKGQILVDGKDIKEVDKYELRRNMAVVLQDVFLFTGDIKSNVRLNNEEITDEDVVAACKYVNADRFIERLPDKYDSHVNERGSTFSQGERQLIAFARAIAFDPPILVLDEATSNIDTETEGLIQDALFKITQGRSTIVVAHRLSTIRNSDKIIVLHKGKIKEIGSHEELMEKQGLYFNLYSLQNMENQNV